MDYLPWFGGRFFEEGRLVSLPGSSHHLDLASCDLKNSFTSFPVNWIMHVDFRSPIPPNAKQGTEQAKTDIYLYHPKFPRCGHVFCRNPGPAMQDKWTSHRLGYRPQAAQIEPAGSAMLRTDRTRNHVGMTLPEQSRSQIRLSQLDIIACDFASPETPCRRFQGSSGCMDHFCMSPR
jgi:hypothetical protein